MLNAPRPQSESGEFVDPDVCLAGVERLVNSRLLSGSDALCKLLQFLAHHTLNSPSEHVKEYEIATQSSVGGPISTRRLTPGFASRWGVCAPSSRNTTKQLASMTQFK